MSTRGPNSQRSCIDATTWPREGTSCVQDRTTIEEIVVGQKKDNKVNKGLKLWMLVTQVWAVATNDDTPFRLVLLNKSNLDNTHEVSVLRHTKCGWHIHELHVEDEKRVISSEMLLCYVDVRHIGQSVSKQRVRVQVCEEHMLQIVCAIAGEVKSLKNTFDNVELVKTWVGASQVSVAHYTRKVTPYCGAAHFSPSAEQCLGYAANPRQVRAFASTTVSSSPAMQRSSLPEATMRDGGTTTTSALHDGDTSRSHGEQELEERGDIEKTDLPTRQEASKDVKLTAERRRKRSTTESDVAKTKKARPSMREPSTSAGGVQIKREENSAYAGRSQSTRATGAGPKSVPVVFEISGEKQMLVDPATIVYGNWANARPIALTAKAHIKGAGKGHHNARVAINWAIKHLACDTASGRCNTCARVGKSETVCGSLLPEHSNVQNLVITEHLKAALVAGGW